MTQFFISATLTDSCFIRYDVLLIVCGIDRKRLAKTNPLAIPAVVTA
jgi:hypothetical protein